MRQILEGRIPKVLISYDITGQDTRDKKSLWIGNGHTEVKILPGVPLATQ